MWCVLLSALSGCPIKLLTACSHFGHQLRCVLVAEKFSETLRIIFGKSSSSHDFAPVPAFGGKAESSEVIVAELSSIAWKTARVGAAEFQKEIEKQFVDAESPIFRILPPSICPQ